MATRAPSELTKKCNTHGGQQTGKTLGYNSSFPIQDHCHSSLPHHWENPPLPHWRKIFHTMRGVRYSEKHSWKKVILPPVPGAPGTVFCGVFFQGIFPISAYFSEFSGVLFFLDFQVYFSELKEYFFEFYYQNIHTNKNIFINIRV